MKKIKGLSKRSFIKISEFNLELRRYAILSEKYCIFHTYKYNGGFSAPKILLYILYKLGYTFITCYPKLSRERLGFGNFMYPKYDKRLYISNYYMNDTTYTTITKWE